MDGEPGRLLRSLERLASLLTFQTALGRGRVASPLNVLYWGGEPQWAAVYESVFTETGTMATTAAAARLYQCASAACVNFVRSDLTIESLLALKTPSHAFAESIC